MFYLFAMLQLAQKHLKNDLILMSFFGFYGRIKAKLILNF